MRRALAAVVAVLAVVAALGAGMWGCSKGNVRRDQKVAEIGGRPAEPAPDGGWKNYRPDRQPYQPDPSRAAAAPSTSPALSPVDSIR